MTYPKPLKKNSRTIVSITPLRVQADSRTFKQAASVARFGYVSVVVEGMKSNFDGVALPFQLRTITRKSPTGEHVRVAGSIADQEVVAGEVKAVPFTNSPTHQEAAPPGRGDWFIPASSSLKQMVRTIKLPSRLLLNPWHKGRQSYRELVLLLSMGRLRLRQAYGELVLLLSIACQRIWQIYRELMISEPAQFVKYVCDFFYKYGVLPLKCTPKASLYYLHAFYQFPAVYLLCLRYGARYIYDAHDFYSQLEENENLSHFWANWVVPFEGLIESVCVKKAATVVTVNDGIAQLIQSRFGRRAIVIRNAHDLRLDRESGQCLRKQLSLSSDQFLLVSVGHAKPGMATAEMFEALLELPANVHIAFLGDGYASYVETVQTKSLEQRVHFVAPVKPDEVVPFIRSADAAIILYYSKSVDYKYSLPNRFFQSIAAELPLFYPGLPEIERIGKQYEIGKLIDPKSPQSISTAIMELINHPDLMLKLKQNLRIVKQELSWEHEEKILHDLLSQLLGDS